MTHTADLSRFPLGLQEADADTTTAGPGEDARTPSDIPARDWRQVLKRAWKQASRHQVALMAAGVAFYAFLSLFPGFVAILMIYGLVTDPAEVSTQVSQLTAGMPAAARDLLTTQLDSLASTSSQTLGVGLIVALTLALWSASAGMGNLMTAVNAAYDEEETRGFVRRKLLALALTVGAILAFAVVLVLVAVVPAAADSMGIPTAVRVLVEVVRWALLLIVLLVCLEVVYRVAPDRHPPQMRWVSEGAAVAVVLWVVACVGFSLYVDHFSSYARTYGALAGVVVLLLWLWLTFYAVLLGAEVNAESEQQTVRDTTTGPEQPIGQRGAVVADSVPGDSHGPDVHVR
jgi:membrane protein